jgi:hypothetical protein
LNFIVIGAECNPLAAVFRFNRQKAEIVKFGANGRSTLCNELARQKEKGKALHDFVLRLVALNHSHNPPEEMDRAREEIAGRGREGSDEGGQIVPKAGDVREESRGGEDAIEI